MKKKAYLIETVRRAWLMNIINFYGLIFILPYYILSNLGPNVLLIYALFLVSIGVFLAIKLSLFMTRKFRQRLLSDMKAKNVLSLAYKSFYGMTIPFVSLIFIPIIITITVAINIIPLSMGLKLVIIFIVDMILVFLFVYRNVSIVNSKIKEVLSYLRSG